MRHIVWTLSVASVVPLTNIVAQTEPGVPDTNVAPLFADDDRLSFVLRAPFNTLFGDRGDDAPSQEATIFHVHGAESTAMDLKVELRGNNRRRSSVCNFPPLRLDFPRSEMGGTIFENQNRIKVVTHCQSGRERYEQYVLLEYLIYRALNVLTDLSFRVRLANFTYIDSDEKKETISRVGFLIEDDDDVAERNGWEVLEVPMVSPFEVHPGQLNLVELFQYMIGHTDWSAFAGQPDDDTCCHNGRLIGSLAGPAYPVPYDFDFAGLINARYAEVAETIGTRSVRQRVYRGICHDDQVLQETVQKYVEAKDMIYELFEGVDGLEERQVKQATDYLDDFYETVTDPGRLRRNLTSRCRRMG